MTSRARNLDILCIWLIYLRGTVLRCGLNIINVCWYHNIVRYVVWYQLLPKREIKGHIDMTQAPLFTV